MRTSAVASRRRSRLPRRWGRLVLTPAAVAGLAVVAAACGSSSPSTPSSSAMHPSTSSSTSTPSSLASLEKAPSASVALSETGSTLLYPLFEAWAPIYQSEHRNITVTTAGTGSGTGISDATSGAVNIGASDAYLSPADVASTPSLENIPLAVSAQMVNYNIPGFTGTLRLNGTVLADIYTGSVTNWDSAQIAKINPGVKLPNVPIVALHRSDGSGDTFLFTTYLSDQDPSWAAKYSYNTTISWPTISNSAAYDGNGGMVTGCQATPGCVAYIGVSYRSETTADGLGEADLANGAGNYEPLTPTSVAAEAAAYARSTPADGAISLIDSKTAPDGYPIVNYEYAIVNAQQPDATTAQAVRALLAWCIDTGNGSAPSFLNAVNFQPLPASALAVSEKLLQKIQ